MNELVVDASVVFKWLIPDSAEADVPAAKALLVDHMQGRVQIVVPALLYYEVGNILLFGRSRPGLEEAEQALQDLFAIPLTVVPPADVACLRLASEHGLTYYDGTYVALAEALDCPLVTADERLARRVRGMDRVRVLGTT